MCIRDSNWYHRDQHGSWSIKAVLPTISASGDYNSLAVSDGPAAQIAYPEAIAPGVTAEPAPYTHRDVYERQSMFRVTIAFTKAT